MEPETHFVGDKDSVSQEDQIILTAIVQAFYDIVLKAQIKPHLIWMFVNSIIFTEAHNLNISVFELKEAFEGMLKNYAETKNEIDERKEKTRET